MSTAFLPLGQAIISALLAAPALAGGHVTGPRTAPVPEEWAQLVEVRVGAAAVTSPFVGPGAPRVSVSEVELTLYVRAAAGGSTDATLDALLQAVDTRLRALDPAALGVLEIGAEVRLVWEQAAGATPHEALTYSFNVTHDVGAGMAPR